MINGRLDRQITFILELDKLKHVLRQSILLDKSRRENDTEHSWHLAMMAVVLREYAAEDVDLLRVMEMVLVHDIVEIDAGDTFLYDQTANQDKHKRELAAADRIFNLLPPDQAGKIRALWEEFESGDTPASRFARALDRLEPILLNFYTQGQMWRERGVTIDTARKRNQQVIDSGSPELGEFVRKLFDEAEEKGYMAE